MTRRARRLPAVLAAAALALTTAACGATDALVGLRPAPAESAAAAPLDVDGATAIAARLLDAQAAAATLEGEKGREARAEVLTGDALVVANQAAEQGAAAGAEGGLAKGAEPTVLAQSQGREWPRAILATTLDEPTSTQYLHVIVSTEPTEPFRITSTVPMFGGAELPALGSETAGAPFLDPSSDEGLVMSPDEALGIYAKALARPAPEKISNVTTEDAFADALRASASRQAKTLGKLGTLRQKHTPDLENTVAFRLADGGAVTFGLLRRIDTISVGKGAKELVLPKDYADLVGEKKVTESVHLSSLEPVVLIVPADDDVRAIGASELLYKGKGS